MITLVERYKGYSIYSAVKGDKFGPHITRSWTLDTMRRTADGGDKANIYPAFIFDGGWATREVRPLYFIVYETGRCEWLEGEYSL